MDTIGGIRFVRFGTRSTLPFGIASLLGRSGFCGPTGDSRGSGRGPRASVHRHGDDEGGLFGIGRLMMCRETTKWINGVWWHEKRLQ